MTSSQSIAVAVSAVAVVMASVLCGMNQGPLSTTAIVRAKVSTLPVDPSRRRRGGADWEVGIGWKPEPLRALALRSEVDGQPYAKLRSEYVDFDSARCRAEGEYAAAIGQPVGTIVRAPTLLAGDPVVLECTSGVALLELDRWWSCTRLCVDAPR